MRIKLVSDLHTEFWHHNGLPDYLVDPADILILAGDISVGPRNTETLLNKLARFHGNIIYVPGNHEYYGHDIHALDDMMLSNRVHMLNPGTATLGGITFIGATMWTDFHSSPTIERIAGKYITDFKRIRGFTTTDAKVLYGKHVKYIADAVKILPGRKVIITHFLPGEHCIHPRWKNKGYPTDELNGYFAPDPRLQREMLEELASNRYGGEAPIVWVFGHTHDSIDVMHNNVRYIANPYGYQGHETNPLFNENLLI